MFVIGSEHNHLKLRILMLCNCNKIQYFNYHCTDNMSNNCFRTLEEAVDYLNEILDDDKQDIGDKVDICQLPPEETADLTDEEKIDDNILEEVVPSDVCGELVVTTNIEEATPESSQPTTSKKAKGASSKEVGHPTWKKCTVMEKILSKAMIHFSVYLTNTRNY